MLRAVMARTGTRARLAKSGMCFVLSVGAAMLAGCEVDTHKNGDGKDVKIETPFGGVHVKTNRGDVTEGIGLQAYPGAQPAKEDNGNDENSSADVGMSFAGFQLRVKTAAFRTGDAPEKVEAFYRDGLRRYGDVIECRDGRAVGVPTRTAEGLGCERNEGVHVQSEIRPHSPKTELRAGSKQHQHLVEIDPEGSGTKFGLVALDLPGKFFAEHGGDEDRQ